MTPNPQLTALSSPPKPQTPLFLKVLSVLAILAILSFVGFFGVFINQKLTEKRYKTVLLNQDTKQYTNYDLNFKITFPKINEVYTNPDKKEKLNMQYTVDIGTNIKKDEGHVFTNILIYNDNIANVSEYIKAQVSTYINVDWKKNSVDVSSNNLANIPKSSISTLTYTNEYDQVTNQALPLSKTYVFIGHNNYTYVVVGETNNIATILNSFEFTN